MHPGTRVEFSRGPGLPENVDIQPYVCNCEADAAMPISKMM